MKNHGNTLSKKENDNSPETKLKVMDDCNLIDREFKIAVIKKLNELQENSERQFNDLRNKINEQREFFTKEMQTIKNNQSEMLEMKNTMNEIQKNLEGLAW